MAGGALSAAAGSRMPMADLVRWLEGNGFLRTSTVREPGEYAVRGGILDLYAAGTEEPVRLDFFGDTLETVRNFDAETQRTTNRQTRIDLVPVSEMALTPESIARFRQRYVAMFGAAAPDDLLYHAVSEGRRHVGMEHWLPLFAEELETLFDHVDGAPVVLDHLVDEAIAERRRPDRRPLQGTACRRWNPATPAAARHTSRCRRIGCISTSARGAICSRRGAVARLSPFAQPEAAGIVDMGGRAGRGFTAERTAENVNVFDAVIDHIKATLKAGKRVVVACWSDGARDRMGQVLVDHGLTRLKPVADWREAAALDRDMTALGVLGLESGFDTATLAVIGEQDILGDRLVRPHAKRRPADYLSDVTSLAEGDLVVHIDHGIARFNGLKTIEAAGAPHDCLELLYAGNDRVYLPVENIELLSRYGSESADVPLDKLGGVAWQSRKARMKKRIRDMAEALIKIAAARAMKHGAGADAAGRALRRVCSALPLRGNRGPADGHRRGARRPCHRHADGPADLRRCRLRQDRGGAARRLHRRDRRAGRWRWWCRRRCSPASTSRRSASASPACRCGSPRPRGWSAPRNSRR